MNVIFTIVNIFGLVTIGFGGLMVTCLLTSVMADDGATAAFIQGTLMTLFSGALMFIPTINIPKKVSRQTGFLMVAITWSIIPVFCTLPLMLYLAELSFVDAYFETVSSLTTTGATTLSGLDQLPMSIN